jgi:hypothetical protein
MNINPDDASRIAAKAMQLRALEQRRLNRIANYMSGRHDPVYAPRGASREYRWIMKIAKENFLPLVVSGISQNLHVDGYRRSDAKAPELGGNATVPATSLSTDEPGWLAFKVNRMISRQHGVHRSILKYGAAYCIVLPAQLSTEDDEQQPVKTAVIRPCSPRRVTALYADLADEWPQIAVEAFTLYDATNPGQGRQIVALYDDSMRYMMSAPVGSTNPGFQIMNDDDPALPGPAIAEHGLGVCPVVRFMHNDDLDGEEDVTGEVEPLIHIQDQINFGTFNLLMTEQYAAFRQRWVTGMQAVTDEDGKVKAPFNPGVDRIFAAEGTDTKFGEFGQSGLKDSIESREASIRHMATMAQVPPYQLLGALVNLSADALAAARDGLDRKVSELQGITTDSWRNVFRLASKAAGDSDGWADINSSVIWRDTSAKSFAATVDALGKAAQMLGIPVTELWRRIPGATADDVNAWIKTATEQGALKELNDIINASLTGDMQAQTPNQDSPYQAGSVGVRHTAGYSQPAIKSGNTSPGGLPDQGKKFSGPHTPPGGG